jgi:hypothetical protein
MPIPPQDPTNLNLNLLRVQFMRAVAQITGVDMDLIQNVILPSQLNGPIESNWSGTLTTCVATVNAYAIANNIPQNPVYTS